MDALRWRPFAVMNQLLRRTDTFRTEMLPLCLPCPPHCRHFVSVFAFADNSIDIVPKICHFDTRLNRFCSFQFANFTDGLINPFCNPFTPISTRNASKNGHFDTILNRFHLFRLENSTHGQINQFWNPFSPILTKMLGKMVISTPSPFDSTSFNSQNSPVVKIFNF